MRSLLLLLASVAGALIFGPLKARGATITVNSSADGGGVCPGPLCTLRQAIAIAGARDTIDFNPSLTTIDLTTAELLIDKSLTISGPGAALLKIRKANPNNGSPTFRILHIASGNFNVTISGVTIAEGYQIGLGENGGGIFIESGNTLTMANCNIFGNGTGTHGGGIYNLGTVTISDSTISDNKAGLRCNGAGIYNAGTMTVTNSTISGNNNSNGNGGGLYNTAGMVTIANSTVSGNFLQVGSGAGIFCHSGTVEMLFSTVFANVGEGGGMGIHNSQGAIRLRSTIIARNLVGAISRPDVSGALTSQGYNLIGNNEGATITPAESTDQIGTAESPIDPMLGPLQDNGGPTFTHAVLSGSSARDKGHSSGSTTDQRGFTRPVDNPAIPNPPGGDGSDIGAFEVQVGVNARSLNISARARVQTGFNVLIGGFIVTGNGSKKVVIRAIGPSLKKFGLTDLLANPVLELHAEDGSLITLNNDWKDDPSQAVQIQNSGFAPEDGLESAIIATLPTASYTAVVRGNASGTGLGLVEVYDLDQTGAGCGCDPGENSQRVRESNPSFGLERAMS